MSINELSIYFFPGGGHSHNGENSSLIETNAYSIFDFNYSTQIGGPSRSAKQKENLEGFRQLIIDLVNNSILAPAGLILQEGMVNGNAHIVSNSITASEIAAQTITSDLIAVNAIVAGLIDADAVTAREIAANTITANEIAANTITANEIDSNTITANEIASNTITANEIAAGAITASEIAANIVLVNQIIASNNYSPGVSGWAINGNGSAEFSSASIRGAIDAGSVFVGANDYWLADGEFSLGGSSGIFKNINGGVTIGGDVTILANATIQGSLVASSVSTPGVDILSDGTLIANNFALYGNGAIVTSGGNFSVTADGIMSATGADISGNITGSAITGSSLTIGGRISLPTDGGIIALGTSSGGSTTQCYVYAGGSQGLFIDTSNVGSMWIAGQSLYVNLNQFTSARQIIGLNTFTGSGTALVVNNGEILRTSSKRELKKNIEDFTNIEIIDSLRPRTFIWRENENSHKPETEERRVLRESQTQIGFIAEEVEEASNGLLSIYNHEEGGAGEVEMYKHLDILALSVAAIQDLRKKIVSLENKLEGY